MDWCVPELAKRRKVELPWESSLMNQIFQEDQFSQPSVHEGMLSPTWDSRTLHKSIVHEAKIVKPLVSATSASTSTVATGDQAFRTVAHKKKPELPWPDKLEDDRTVALGRWKLLVNIAPEASRLGRQLLAANEASDNAAKAKLVLEDTFGSKATATLESRAGSLLAFVRWVRSCDEEAQIFPMLEERAYDYLCMLRQTKAAATKAMRFRESVAFAYGVIGLEGADHCMQSRRLQGASIASLVNKGPDSDMDPLELAQVLLLEEAAVRLPSGPDKVFAGFCSFCTFTVARMSDTFFCQHEPILDLDALGNGFIEVPVMKTKTSNTSGRRTKALPLVGLTCGITRLGWAEAYLQERKLQGLVLKSEGPLMPAVAHDGTWRQARLTTSEACVWLRELIRSLGGKISPNVRLGSHSAKKTLLSWLAKFGTAMGVRRILGHHVKPKEGSALVYSRDALAGPLREMERMLKAVAEKKFHPDRTRSGRFADESAMPDEAESAACLFDDSQLAGTESEEQANEGQPDDGWQVPEEEFALCKSCDMTHNGDLLVDCTTCGIEACNSCADMTKENEVDWICHPCLDRRDSLEDQLDTSGAEGLSSSSEEEEDGGEEEDAVAAEAVAAQEPREQRQPVQIAVFAQHLKLGTLHYVRDVSTLTCGRRYSSSTHKILRTLPVFEWPTCSDCFGCRTALEPGCVSDN
jgi:hypothetical protein